MFKNFTFNIPFVDALERMLTYAKFMKFILRKKEKIIRIWNYYPIPGMSYYPTKETYSKA